MEKINIIENSLKDYVSKENDIVSNLANISAILYNNIDKINWLGFYLVRNDELILGPFQGLQAVSKIKFGSGVCGACAIKKETIVVDDVHCFEGHIACDLNSKSEIVIPVFKADGSLFAVLDVDSPVKERFAQKEQLFFESISKMITEVL